MNMRRTWRTNSALWPTVGSHVFMCARSITLSCDPHFQSSCTLGAACEAIAAPAAAAAGAVVRFVVLEREDEESLVEVVAAVVVPPHPSLLLFCL